jgi:hypothetical protein
MPRLLGQAEQGAADEAAHEGDLVAVVRQRHAALALGPNQANRGIKRDLGQRQARGAREEITKSGSSCSAHRGMLRARTS